MLETGFHSRKSLSQTFNIPYSTVANIFQIYLKENRNEKKRTGGYKSKKLNPDHITWLKQELDNDCSQTLKTLQTKIKEAFQLSISTTSIATYISSFNYTLKRVQNITQKAVSSSMLEERKTYAINFLRIANSDRNLLFFDETGFCVSMRNYYGRSLKGKRAMHVVPALKTRNRTIMAAMNREKLFYYKVLDAAGNRKKLAEYLNELFEKLSDVNLNNVVFVMDNARFHHCTEIRSLIEENGHEILYLPPYSPFFNPIENLFSQWKSVVRSRKPDNEEQLLTAIDGYQYIVSEEDCQNYYRHIVNNCLSCIEGKSVYNE